MSEEMPNDLQLHGLHVLYACSDILSAVHRESSRLREMHIISHNDADSHASRYVFHVFKGQP